MFKHILQAAGDINWMAIFALVTFFALFTISAVVVFTRRRSWVDHMANLPLDEPHSPNGEKHNAA